jgi:hypothetical protein
LTWRTRAEACLGWSCCTRPSPGGCLGLDVADGTSSARRARPRRRAAAQMHSPCGDGRRPPGSPARRHPAKSRSARSAPAAGVIRRRAGAPAWRRLPALAPPCQRLPRLASACPGLPPLPALASPSTSLLVNLVRVVDEGSCRPFSGRPQQGPDCVSTRYGRKSAGTRQVVHPVPPPDRE